MTTVQSVNQFVEKLVNTNLSGEKLLAHLHSQEVQGALSHLLTTKSHEKRRLVDKNRPKRALSAYLHFTRDKRTDVAAQNPQMNQKDLLCELGKLWKALTPAQQAPYVERHRADTERYIQETASYVPPPNLEQELSPRSKKQKRVVKPTGYQLFCQHRRAELKNSKVTLGATEIMRTLGHEWNALAEAVRAEWKQRAAAPPEAVHEAPQPVVSVPVPPQPVAAPVEEAPKRSKKSRPAPAEPAPAPVPEPPVAKPAREAKSKKKTRRVVDEE